MPIEPQDHWEQHILACEKSDLNSKRYCATANVDYDRFLYHRKKIKNSKEPLSLIPLKVKNSSQIQSVCSIEVSPGRFYLFMIYGY